jgi:Glycosyl transferases group 1
MSRKRSLLVVAGEDLWPRTNGGRERTAGISEALAEEFDVVVAVPEGSFERSTQHPLPVLTYGSPHPSSSYAQFVSWRPRLGNAVIDASSRADLRRIAAETRAESALFAHSYLAAVASDTIGVPSIVDFPNVELLRLRSLAGAGSGRNELSARLEAAKARLWEPAVARRARLALAVAESDARLLSSWGAAVRVIPNAVHARGDAVRSPRDGHVLFLASAGYAPNDRAAERLVRRIWPKVVREEPGARLRIVGRDTRNRYAWAIGTPGVDVVGEVADTGPDIDGAAAVLVPVDSGGGTQLKVLHALARGRAVVASPYSARSVPEAAATGCVVAADDDEFAARTLEILRDLPRRHALENCVRALPIPTWRDAAQPLIDAIGDLGGRS